MATKYTGKELQVKREIDRINRQIRQAFRKLGAESRLAQQYETLLHMGKTSVSSMRGVWGTGVRYTKEGIPQISASKSAIWEFSNISAYEKQLKMLGRQQTVENAQRAIISAYEKRENVKVTKKADKKRVLESEKRRYELTEKAFESGLQKLYEIEKKRGVRLKAHEDIKAMTKGRWTSEETLIKMYETLDNALQQEQAEIVKDVFSQNQW